MTFNNTILEKNPILNADGSPMRTTQEDYIVLFNNSYKIMASLADYYNAGKYDDDLLLEGLQEDFSNWVVTSDREIHNYNSLEASIISYYGSKVVEPFERKFTIAPFTNGPSLDKVLSTKEGIVYLQNIFNTKDTKDEILTTLIRLSGTDSHYISIWNRGLCRKREMEQTSFLIYEKPDFYIFGCDACHSKGRAREVKLVVEK